MKQIVILSFFISLVVNTVSMAAELCSAPTVENIMPGVYQTQIGYCYILEGPTASADRFIYTLRGYKDFTGCLATADPFTTLITTGSADSHPDIGGRDIVPSLQETYLYGFVTGTSGFGGTGSPLTSLWRQNKLIGVRQSGNQLILGLFSDGVNQAGNYIDFTTPVQSVILTKISEIACLEADPNRDGETNILDVITLINFVLSN